MTEPMTVERFLTKVDVAPVGCWEWKGKRNDEGYGHLRVEGRFKGAHVLSEELFSGKPIPPGAWVCHHCDNPSCVRPSHLYVGTATTNAGDRESRGRGNHPNGSSHGMAKLKNQQVLDIRAKYASGGHSYGTLAAKYGVTKAMIRNIVKRWSWTHI